MSRACTLSRQLYGQEYQKKLVDDILGAQSDSIRNIIVWIVVCRLVINFR